MFPLYFQAQVAGDLSCVFLKFGYTPAIYGANKAYKRLGGKMNFYDAKKACEAEGSVLAMPKTEDDIKDIWGIISGPDAANAGNECCCARLELVDNVIVWSQTWELWI